MRSDEMLNELEANFGLKDNHIKILKELQLSGELTADKLAKNTGVPLGRIYDFLNDLVESKLVLKSTTFPSVYSVDNLEQRVMEFMRYQTDNLVHKEQKLMTILSETKDIEQTFLITDKEKLAFEEMKSIMESKEIKFIVKNETIPSIFYSYNEDEFIKMRNYFAKKTKDKGAIYKGGADRTRIMVYRTIKEAMLSKKKIPYIMDKHTMDLFLRLISGLNREKKKEIIKTVLSQMNQCPNVKVYVVEDTLPISVIIFDNKRVLLRLVHLGAPLGIFIQSEKTAQFYNSFFNDLISKSKTAQKYLKEALGSK